MLLEASRFQRLEIKKSSSSLLFEPKAEDHYFGSIIATRSSVIGNTYRKITAQTFVNQSRNDIAPRFEPQEIYEMRSNRSPPISPTIRSDNSPKKSPFSLRGSGASLKEMKG